MPRRRTSCGGSTDPNSLENGAVYDLPASVTVPIGDEAMLRYGVSATPTFVFVDRKGVVAKYLPYRMTEERLSEAIDALLR